MEKINESPIFNKKGPEGETGEIDFVSTFKERMANASLVPERERELVAFDYRETDLKSVSKVITAGIFLWGGSEGDEYNLWILPENDPSKRTYHDQVDKDLAQNIGASKENMILGPFSAHVITGIGKKDSKIKTVLAVHESFANAIESDKNEGTDEAFFKNWKSFMERYGINTIVGKFKETLPVAKQTTKENPREILNKDIIGKILEGREIMKVAKEEDLTNYGAMRLFLGYFAAKRINRSYDLREHAKRIKKEYSGHPYER